MNYKHGMVNSPTWRSWSLMRRRCSGYTEVHKRRYAERGIYVCERWKQFSNFLADMGERPAGKTLDRIDPNGPYSPENCRWATIEEQMQNKSNTILLSKDGITKALSVWARELGLHRQTIKKRLDAGWSIHEVLSSHKFHENKGRRPAHRNAVKEPA